MRCPPFRFRLPAIITPRTSSTTRFVVPGASFDSTTTLPLHNFIRVPAPSLPSLRLSLSLSPSLGSLKFSFSIATLRYHHVSGGLFADMYNHHAIVPQQRLVFLFHALLTSLFCPPLAVTSLNRSNISRGSASHHRSFTRTLSIEYSVLTILQKQHFFFFFFNVEPPP